MLISFCVNEGVHKKVRDASTCVSLGQGSSWEELCGYHNLGREVNTAGLVDMSSGAKKKLQKVGLGPYGHG